MITEPTTVEDLAAALRRSQDEAAAQRAGAQRAAAAVDAAEREAAEAAEAARLADQATKSPAPHIFELLTRLTTEVADARVAAIEAVRTGSEPALEAWLRYRRLRAANRGRWDAVASLYQGSTGRPTPPGSWGPPATYDPSGRDDTMAPEDFPTFLQNAIVQAETAIRQAWMLDTREQLERPPAAAEAQAA